MIVELYTELQSHNFVVDEVTSKWIKAHLDAGREFEIFFPEYEVK